MQTRSLRIESCGESRRRLVWRRAEVQLEILAAARETDDDAAVCCDSKVERIAAAWDAEARERGRPTIAMALLVRLMVIKQRTGRGYETLVREVSDSLHLRRFCGLSLTASMPLESTIRKLVRRLGPEVVDAITRTLIDKAQRERRFTARAMRCDSTVIEADVRWPSDAALALDAARRLARESARVAAVVGAGARRVQNRSRAIGRRLRMIGRTIGRRLGRAGSARKLVLELTGQTGQLVRCSVREARRLAAQARTAARGRGAGSVRCSV